MEAFGVFRKILSQWVRRSWSLRGFELDSPVAADLEERRHELRGWRDASEFWTGWIPRNDLYRLFEGADAYIAPSRFEGFGMPILEALAAGIPSACSGIAPMSEIAGTAATQFDPDLVSEIASAMELITNDMAFRLDAATSGPKRGRQFDWDATAELTLQQLERLK